MLDQCERIAAYSGNYPRLSFGSEQRFLAPKACVIELKDQSNHWLVSGHELMDCFRFCFPYRVGVADINYAGHVANSAVLNIFQDARIDYLAALGPFTELDLGGCGIIMPEAHVYFRAEMFLGDQLTVGVRCKELKRSSFMLEYRVERNASVTAEGETPLVCFNYQTRKACRLPAPFRLALIDFDQLNLA